MWCLLSLSEVVRIGLELQGAGGGGNDFIGQAFGFGIGHGSSFGGEGELELGAGVCRADPAHQRVGTFGGLWLKLQPPAFGFALAGLGGRFGGLVDANGHAGQGFQIWLTEKFTVCSGPLHNMGFL
jgi:hypothetical protein